MWEPAFILRGWFSSHKKNQNLFQLARDGLYQYTHMGILDGDIAFCFTPFQNERSGPKFMAGPWTASYFSIIMQKGEREKKKSIFLMPSWGWSILWSLEGSNILLYGSSAETFIKPECSEGGNISWPVVMKLHCFWVSQEMRGNLWSVLSTVKL